MQYVDIENALLPHQCWNIGNSIKIFIYFAVYMGKHILKFTHVFNGLFVFYDDIIFISSISFSYGRFHIILTGPQRWPIHFTVHIGKHILKFTHVFHVLFVFYDDIIFISSSFWCRFHIFTNRATKMTNSFCLC